MSLNMSWSSRRKSIYTLSFIIIALAICAFVFFNFFYKKATCTDGIQNQNELGVDCGGICPTLCVNYNNPSILWTRWSESANTGTYTILAYGQNPNVGAGAVNVPYSYKIYDKQDLLLYENSGTAYIPPLNNFVIYDDSIFIGDKVPARVDVTISTSSIAWQKNSGQELGITTISQNLVNADTKPKLYATLKNSTLLPIQNIESYAILYDENNNAVAFSKTKTDVIDKNSTANIVFTWPDAFTSNIVKTDIVSEVIPK